MRERRGHRRHPAVLRNRRRRKRERRRRQGLAIVRQGQRRPGYASHADAARRRTRHRHAAARAPLVDVVVHRRDRGHVGSVRRLPRRNDDGRVRSHRVGTRDRRHRHRRRRGRRPAQRRRHRRHAAVLRNRRRRRRQRHRRHRVVVRQRQHRPRHRGGSDGARRRAGHRHPPPGGTAVDGVVHRRDRRHVGSVRRLPRRNDDGRVRTRGIGSRDRRHRHRHRRGRRPAQRRAHRRHAAVLRNRGRRHRQRHRWRRVVVRNGQGRPGHAARALRVGHRARHPHVPVRLVDRVVHRDDRGHVTSVLRLPRLDDDGRGRRIDRVESRHRRHRHRRHCA